MKNMKHSKKQFKTFEKFVKWYMKLGGQPLTPIQIELTYPKFKTVL